MKKTKILLGLSFAGILGLTLIAADHIDAPAVSNTKADITDLYAFQGANTNNLVFVANLQGLLSPTATAGATFDENVLTEINIDNNGNNVEDLVIQAIPRDGKMYFFGPVAPGTAGLSSTIKTGNPLGSVDITPYGSTAITSTSNGASFFAGPRDDPFFFDLGRYRDVIAGTVTGFNNPGTDTFAGTNVLSIVVEVPKAMLGGTGTLNTWVETKTK
jgi:Domain of unknown function (DUF4331)